MKRTLRIISVAIGLFILSFRVDAQDVPVWGRFEKEFTSSKTYNNPLYEAKLNIRFVAPSGRVKNVAGFWDGGTSWRVRFMPDEKGEWTWTSSASDGANTGLNGQSGSFNCVTNRSAHAIYQKGAITRRPGVYYLEHADGTPFFFTACTAWNGTLKSTDEEWAYYLDHRARHHYNTIQFVTTQWRGGDKNSLGQVAFEGSGMISIHPEFFQHLDKKIDKVNEQGLVAAPVLLWALQSSRGRHLSPGYFLPEDEAVLLARYMVARYGSHHVIWILGGDGKYIDTQEQRWKNIGRGVFGDEHPGVVSLHPGGKSWIGDAFAGEEWLDIVGYQSGHNSTDNTKKWITTGPAASRWDKLAPKVLINMEPVYEEIHPEATAADLRNASYWSVLSTPVAGITYGANGVWPWLRQGEEILNHAYRGENATRWREALDLPGSVQVGYLAAFFRQLEWWKLKPAQHLLMAQPGDADPGKFVSVARADDENSIVAYMPVAGEIVLYNPGGSRYEGQWFDAVGNKMVKAIVSGKNGLLRVSAPSFGNDGVLVLRKSK